MIEFWFDFASTYSYPAAMRIDSAARRLGCPVAWRPFLLGPIFRQQGWNDSPFNLYPAKGRYMWRDLERICARAQLAFRKPSQFPRNGLLAARVVCTEPDASWVPEFVRRVFTAGFAADADIADAGVLRDCLDGLVAAPAGTLAATQDDDVKSRLRMNTEHAVARGIFGAPTFVVGDELFWGHDRLDEALQWWRDAHAEAAASAADPGRGDSGTS
ncbi:2-hydroxychromene-2-carboxylate isomerase [Aquisalimonas lutea]|uniref:2-hydroxychromene-2-carboxylate isomerase n=1 Tax=Aquisalimonas lutea TaxID=1327750 RepID=UPI0025B46D6D|nr:2-hydroxychromene-2-carboxylate isomerase [Aquisalimonas lutea]MDN3519554.1 2-hydroxychromene-2-carboxylate isomerase [Aquisalimonas lutea]